MTAGPAAAAGVIKRSLAIAGHSTSVSLEEAFWSALKRIAEMENRSVSAIVADVDRARAGANLSSAIRVHVLRWFQDRANA